MWGCSSVGRAPALQAGGHGFESHHLHQPAVPAAVNRESGRMGFMLFGPMGSVELPE